MTDRPDDDDVSGDRTGNPDRDGSRDRAGTGAETLHFGFSADPPTIQDVEVYDRIEREFLDAPFVFEVIGASHHIYSTTKGFYEVSSCRTVEDGDTYDLQLGSGIDREFAFAVEGLECRTGVWTESLSAFPDDRTFDVSHDFGADAVTAIAVGDRHYDTYHTYPEHDQTLCTRSVFPGPDAEDGRGGLDD
jgi:hypothetical protein